MHKLQNLKLCLREWHCIAICPHPSSPSPCLPPPQATPFIGLLSGGLGILGQSCRFWQQEAGVLGPGGGESQGPGVEFYIQTQANLNADFFAPCVTQRGTLSIMLAILFPSFTLSGALSRPGQGFLIFFTAA